MRWRWVLLWPARPSGAQRLRISILIRVLRLIALLKKASAVDSPEEEYFWGYHFVTGALMLTGAHGTQ